MGLLLLLRDLLIAALDVVSGRRRRRYEHWVDIRAPRALVWDMLKARDMTFDGFVPLRVVAEPVAGRPGLERVNILAGETRLVMLTRIADERPEQAILFELLADGTDAALIEGEDDYIGFVLSDLADGTRLDMTREATVARWYSRLTIPVGLRSGGRRYKRKAEQLVHEQSAGSIRANHR